MIQLQNVSRKIKTEWVLKEVNLQLPEGHIYGFIGRNGSGKTMLLRAILGLMQLSTGQITVDGQRVTPEHPPKNVGFLLEHPSFLKQFSGLDNLRMIAPKNLQSDKALMPYLEEVGLSDAAKRSFGSYSLGMKQRLGIAGALLGSPRWILLDEPTVSLDTEGIALLTQLIRKYHAKGCTFLISSHEKEWLQSICDEIYAIRQGTLID